MVLSPKSLSVALTGMQSFSPPCCQYLELTAITHCPGSKCSNFQEDDLVPLTFLGLTVFNMLFLHFYQRVSIASYANRWYSQRKNVRLSVCLSVTLRYCIKTKKASVMISSPSESLNILVSRNVWFITKFDRGHPERGRYLRLGWVRTGDFCDFSTNKPPYLRNGAR